MCQRPLRSWVKASVSNVVFAFVIHASNAYNCRKEGRWVQRQVMCLIEVCLSLRSDSALIEAPFNTEEKVVPKELRDLYL